MNLISRLAFALVACTAIAPSHAADKAESKPPSDLIVAKNGSGGPAASATTSNVVLGRNLIAATKSLESVIRLNQSVLAVQNRLTTLSFAKEFIPSNLEKQLSDLTTRSASREEHIATLLKGLEQLAKEATDAFDRRRDEGPIPVPVPGKPIVTEDGQDSLGLLSRAKDLKQRIDLLTNDISEDRAQIEREEGIRDKILRIESNVSQRTWELESLARRINDIDGLAASQGMLSLESVQANAYDAQLAPQGIARSVAVGPSISDYFSKLKPPGGPPELYDRAPIPASPLPPSNLSEVKGILEPASRELARLVAESRAVADMINSEQSKLDAVKVSVANFATAVSDTDVKAKACIKVVRDLIDAHQRDKAILEKALADRDGELNQNQINQLLVYAVYGMIGSIIVLFVLLRWYAGSLTEVIVEQRVFVEVLSMGFLLVTVIILGSGKLIQGEGLAGLLGTIAGYIFAKKAVDTANGRSNTPSASALDRQLAEDASDLAALEVKLAEVRSEAGANPNEGQSKEIAKLEELIRAKQARTDKAAAMLLKVRASSPDEVH